VDGLGQQILDTDNGKLLDSGLMLKTGTVADATLFAAPISIKNDKGERYPEMHKTKKPKQWRFDTYTPIRMDAESGLMHTVATTAANAHDITQSHTLLHGVEEVVIADTGYRGFKRAKRSKSSTRV
jgi:IS5 family transposase